MSLTVTQHIVSTPDTRSGRPRIDGTRITVQDVVLMHLKMGQSLEEIAGGYDLTLAQLHAALAFYYDHRDEIEQAIAQDDAYYEAMKKANPSLLMEKLRALKRG